MSRIGIQAAVTMGQLQNKLDMVGHNIANSSTTGYKSRQSDFSALLHQQINNHSDPSNAEGRRTPDGIRIGTGAVLGHTNMNFTTGAIQQTGRGLDVALLNDNHLLQVEVTENGRTENRYTRSGALYLSPMENGQVLLTNQDGHPIIGNNGPIVLQEGFESVRVTGNGLIETTRNGEIQQEDRLAIVEAVRPRFFEAAGENNFRLPDQNETGYEAEEIIRLVGENELEIKTGALEASNVDIAKEMTDMVTTQRSYQFNARTISMNDQMMGLINQLR